MKWFLLGAAASLLIPSVAQAYATPTVFDDDPVGGGGGGRYFTGTVRDRYTCDVCHEGGREPAVVVAGLPEGPIVWGQQYPFLISIGDADARGGVGAVAEVTELSGLGVGTVEKVPIDDLQPSEMCESGLPAVSIYDPPGRSVVAMSQCGAHTMRFVWTAPDVPSREAILHLSAVASDASDEPTGDGTFAAEYVLHAPDDPLAVGGGCRVGGGATPTTLLLLVLFGLRRTRQ